MSEEAEKRLQEELQVYLKSTRRPGFKAGADLSGKVNVVAIEVDEESSEDSDMFSLRIHFKRNARNGQAPKKQ